MKQPASDTQDGCAEPRAVSAGAHTADAAAGAPEPRRGVERRKSNLLRTYWQQLRGERAFPSRADLDPAAIANLRPYCLVIGVDGETGDFTFEHLGPALDNRYGLLHKADEGGLAGRDRLFGMIEELAREVLARRAPAEKTGTFRSRWGDAIKYRCTIVPLSDDQVTIDAMVGLVGYAEIRHAEIAGLTIRTPYEF